MKIVIVGSGPAGISAAVTARAFDREADVTIITHEMTPSHKRPGVALALEHPDTDILDIADWSQEKLEGKQISLVTGTKAVSGDLDSKTLTIEKSDGSKDNISYDKLILATGGVARRPDIDGIDLEGVYTIQTISDARILGDTLSSLDSVVVVGAGFSGLEIAERLYTIGKEIHVIIRSRIMRRQLEESMSEELRSRVPKGVHIHLGSSPERVVGTAGKINGIVLNGNEIGADAVVFMTGVKPNIELARKLGLKIGDLGGIVVDSKMQTSSEDVYAAGDCVEMIDDLTDKPILMPIGSTAARAGRQAAVSAVGRERVYDDNALRLQYDRIFKTDIVCVGHSSTTAGNHGIDTDVRYVEDPAEFMKIALVLDKDGILIGGQVISARMGARVGYQILKRVNEGVKLDERPLLKARHQQTKDLMEQSLGAIE